MSKADIVRHYVEAYRNGDTLSCADLHNAFPDYTVQQIFNFLHTEKVFNYLLQRDIPAPPRQKSRKSLTDKQRDWLAFCTNPYTTKKLNHLCTEFGITIDQHTMWMRQAHFKDEYERLIKAKISGVEGEVYRRVASKAVNEGDVKAVETLYRMAGKPLVNAVAPSSSGTVPIEDVIRAMQQICTPDQLASISAILLTGSQPTSSVLELEPTQQEINSE